MKHTIPEETRELFRAILTLKDEEECAAFFEDICTIKEIKDLSQRLQVAAMLNKGEKYQNIEQATGASTATISRVNSALREGGGYARALDELGVEQK